MSYSWDLAVVAQLVQQLSVPGTSIADDKNSVAIGYGSDTQGQGANSENTVSVGGLLGGAIRRITQVADGVDNMDAINVSQLKREIAKIGVGAQLIDHADTLLTTEKTERIAGDKDLADKLAVEIAARQQAVDDEAKERANADIALSTAIGNEAKLRAAADDAEKDARIAGDAATKAERIEAVNAERDARILAINNEAMLRANADAQETADRIAGDTAEKNARIAAITNEATLRADADTAEKNARIAGDAMTKAERIAAVNAERDARIEGDTALAQRIEAEAATRKAEVNRLDGRLNQASRRLDDIEKSAYRGVAIALAAQQAVPNIRSGQVAVFAGVGHFEGETAGSVGLVTSFFASRVSLSGSVGYAGGNEVGSRIGLSYAF
ncbi:YadA-like family protein [Acinetobacter proteolyticus]|nr:YadA-like family protein [Acinetobacter proteolyticus]WEI19867.1 YadA-like family protein [Acinetobacter proteolyticus]